ncbi:MAG: hypothetical protein LH479_07970, partial [Polaromonas sp.]|nr:hypothetical protein [Polaromonas sp.]
MPASAPEFSAELAPTAVSLFDARPFFEKALQLGLQTGVLDACKLAEIAADAPKGMVQIARHFGNENLRPDLELARARIVNLVSLNLEHSTGGDLQRAAEALRTQSFLSRSKGGSDMLRALLALPESSNFDTQHDDDAGDAAVALRALADWSLKSLGQYQAELARRTPHLQQKDAAIWLAASLGVDQAELEEAHTHAEAVIRTALLARVTGRTDFPDCPGFESMIGALRSKFGAARSQPGKVASQAALNARQQVNSKAAVSAASKSPGAAALRWQKAVQAAMPVDLPDEFRAALGEAQTALLADAPRLLDASLPVRALFAKDSDEAMPPLLGRYFWIEDIASELGHHERAMSSAWDQLTSGNSDDGSLLTVFVCMATGVKPITMLTEKSAASLLRKVRKAGPGAGFDPGLVLRYLRDYAPA